MKLYAYVILKNLIAESEQLSKDIARFKSYTAKNLICYLDKNKVKTILEQLSFIKAGMHFAQLKTAIFLK